MSRGFLYKKGWLPVWGQLFLVMGLWVNRKERVKTAERKKYTDLERIRKELRKMAFSKTNDCAKLALDAYRNIEKLDLSLLSEIKKSSRGVEIKLLDRTKILAQLAALSDGQEQSEAAEKLLKVLGKEEKHG